MAEAIGRPGASRAVGVACGASPPPIAVPRHRAVRMTGRLTGFAGGMARKRTLPALEGGARRLRLL